MCTDGRQQRLYAAVLAQWMGILGVGMENGDIDGSQNGQVEDTAPHTHKSIIMTNPWGVRKTYACYRSSKPTRHHLTAISTHTPDNDTYLGWDDA